HVFSWPPLKTAEAVLEGPLFVAHKGDDGSEEANLAADVALVEAPPFWWHVGLLLALGFFFLALFKNEGFRRRSWRALVHTWRTVCYLVWDLPAQMIPVEALGRVFESWVFQLV